MRNAETVLNVIQDRGKRRLPLEDVYRQLYNPDLYLRGYGRIYRNRGAMTRGVTEETVDGMSIDKIQAIIVSIRSERWHWTPVKRVEIPKKRGGTRPLGKPTWSDKLLQEVIRSILEAYYEPQFSDLSHGFRPRRGCHTALSYIRKVWRGTKWFIEGDIKGCFDNIDHQVLLEILRASIHDNRFLRLIEGLVKAGYVKEWTYYPTLSGTPQGGIVSPILANIYLDRLDKFVEQTLIPEYTRGRKREWNPEYRKRSHRIRMLRKQGRTEEAMALRKETQQISALIPDDPNYRRLRYIRYADDHLFGFVGPKAEAEEIKVRVKEFAAQKLRLELSEEKTLITNAAKGAAKFLGHEIQCQWANSRHDHRGRRSVNGSMALRVPAAFVEERCQRYERDGKAIHRAELLNDTDFSIVAQYQSEYRGYVEFYRLAVNLRWLDKVRWTMETSLLKTLAHKFKSSVSKMAKHYDATCATPDGPRKCLEVRIERPGKKPLIARFGGLSLARKTNAVLVDKLIVRWVVRTELLQRLLANECEICGSTDKVEVHHIRKLSDLKVKGQQVKPLWRQIMSARRRKTLVACQGCHDDIHAGRPTKVERAMEGVTGEPDDAKVSSPVRRGAEGKGA
jgi:group II intron reverse transcriptase/maturase